MTCLILLVETFQLTGGVLRFVHITDGVLDGVVVSRRVSQLQANHPSQRRLPVTLESRRFPDAVSPRPSTQIQPEHRHPRQHTGPLGADLDELQPNLIHHLHSLYLRGLLHVFPAGDLFHLVLGHAVPVRGVPRKVQLYGARQLLRQSVGVLLADLPVVDDRLDYEYVFSMLNEFLAQVAKDKSLQSKDFEVMDHFIETLKSLFVGSGANRMKGEVQQSSLCAFDVVVRAFRTGNASDLVVL